MQPFLNFCVKIPNPEVVGLKPLDKSRNESVYHPSEVDQMSTFELPGAY